MKRKLEDNENKMKQLKEFINSKDSVPFQPPSRIRIAFIGIGLSHDMQNDALLNLQSKRNFWGTQIEIVEKFECRIEEPPYINPNFENDVKNLNLDEIDAFFVVSYDDFPSWLGDYLQIALEKAKGLVFSSECTNDSDEGVCGAIEEELPFNKGAPLLSERVSLKMTKAPIGIHPTMKGFQSISFPKLCVRHKVTKRKPKFDEKIGIITTWSDNTPMIITKEYMKGERANWGRIVVLNFMTDTTEVCDHGWDPNTDGDIMMQNSIIWAAKKQGSEINERSAVDILEKIKEMLKCP